MTATRSHVLRLSDTAWYGRTADLICPTWSVGSRHRPRSADLDINGELDAATVTSIRDALTIVGLKSGEAAITGHLVRILDVVVARKNVPAPAGRAYWLLVAVQVYDLSYGWCTFHRLQQIRG
jgi:hypothetical protein